MIIVLMGVAGSGKTTIGQQLAALLGWQFVEGDDFHPASNVAKMTQGQPLTDTDREPWLAALRQVIQQFQTRQASAVIACSALKQRYRQVLQGTHGDRVRFVYLQAQPATLRSRLAQRQNHFMKADMLASQLATLEIPDHAIVIDVDEPASIDGIVAAICRKLGLKE